MADYTPIIVRGAAFTTTASGTLAGGDLVVVSGSDTVAKAGANALGVIGVAGHDAVTGQQVTVYANKPIHKGIASGAITAGNQLVSASGAAGRNVAAAGVVATQISASPTEAEIETALTTARSIIGVALTTAADGAVVKWQAS